MLTPVAKTGRSTTSSNIARVNYALGIKHRTTWGSSSKQRHENKPHIQQARPPCYQIPHVDLLNKSTKTVVQRMYNTGFNGKSANKIGQSSASDEPLLTTNLEGPSSKRETMFHANLASIVSPGYATTNPAASPLPNCANSIQRTVPVLCMTLHLS